MDICKLEFGAKSIPVTYREEDIKSRIEEADYMLKKASEYFNNKEISQEEIDISIANEVIYSSFIEGYEIYRQADWLIKAKKGSSKAEKTNICGYEAYKQLIGNNIPSNKEELREVWIKLIKYKPYLTNFRVLGVKVGNRIHTVHVAPPAKYVRSLLERMYSDTLTNYNGILKSIIFHYIFTYIHPFIDGNGRTARLVEQAILMDEYNLRMCIQISGAIIQNKKSYYSAFKSGQTFGKDHLDVLSIDITDFINENCKFISQGIQSIMVEAGYDNNVNLPDILDMSKNEWKMYSRKELIDICGGVDKYCDLILTGKIMERDFGFMYSKYKANKHQLFM